MEVSKVLADVAFCIEEFDLLGHPFYRTWSRGELSHADLREYATDYDPHVAAFPTYLSALHSRLPKANVRPQSMVATSDCLRTMVLVKACWRIFTAFSQTKSLACAEALPARSDVKSPAEKKRKGLPNFLAAPESICSYCFRLCVYAIGNERGSTCWLFARSCKLDLFPAAIEMAAGCVVVVRSNVCQGIGRRLETR